MTEMVERVARAIAIRQEGHDILWRDFDDAARAAIAAMREPTQGMADSVCGLTRTQAIVVWQAMIDAAAKD